MGSFSQYKKYKRYCSRVGRNFSRKIFWGLIWGLERPVEAQIHVQNHVQNVYPPPAWTLSRPSLISSPQVSEVIELIPALVRVFVRVCADPPRTCRGQRE